MAFNKVFIILALASCALAMPVHQVDQTKNSIDAGSTSASMDLKAQESTTTIAITDKAEASEIDATTEKNIVNEESADEDLVKRSIVKESSDVVADADADAEDMETAAGTNVLRPLFVYRQQVAYRQRIRNANRRGNRRF